METGSFEKQIVLTPDLCGRRAGLSPLAAFTIFQGIASEHAEAIGVGGAAMAKRGEFWLTVHSRVDFYEPAYLMDALTAQTWPERCEGRDIRCFRSYRANRSSRWAGRSGQFSARSRKFCALSSPASRRISRSGRARPSTNRPRAFTTI